MTFQKLESWLNELEIYGTKPNMIKMVVGNKLDQSHREVSRDEGIRFAKKHRTLFLETSAKTAEGVKETFEEVVRKILETSHLWDNHSVDASRIALNGGEDHEGASYCSGLNCTLTWDDNLFIFFYQILVKNLCVFCCILYVFTNVILSCIAKKSSIRRSNEINLN